MRLHTPPRPSSALPVPGPPPRSPAESGPGGLRWRPCGRHGVWLLAALLVCASVGDALAGPGQAGIVATLLRWTPVILTGFLLNILMSAVAIAVGTVAGAILGIAQISLLRLTRAAARAVTEFFRNAPWLVLLFYCMFLLPFQVRVGGATVFVPPWIKAALGLSLAVMANVSEIVRGGLLSIPAGQWEAAESLAYSRQAALWHIILPQCVKRMLPPWMNLYALLIMSTPLASVAGVNEAMTMTQAAINADGRPALLPPMYLYVLFWFFIYSYPIARWTVRLERRYAVGM